MLPQTIIIISPLYTHIPSLGSSLLLIITVVLIKLRNKYYCYLLKQYHAAMQIRYFTNVICGK